MGQQYRQIGGDGTPFNTVQGQIILSVEELVNGNAREIIALKAVTVAEDLIAMWELSKDLIEPVEGK